MKKIVAILSMASSIFASNIIEPYTAYITYDNNVKDKAAIAGVYFAHTNNSLKFEVDTSFMRVNYLPQPDLSQTDVSFIAHYLYKAPCKGNLKSDFKLGIHNIFLNQSKNPNNYDKTLIFGLEYGFPKYTAGLDIYLSNINGYSVCQYSPKFRLYLTDLKSCAINCKCKKCKTVGSVYLETTYNYIKTANTSLTTYNNVDIKLQINSNNLITSIYSSLGKSKYKVSNNGLKVDNLEEENKYSYGLGFKYLITNKDSLELAYTHTEFEQNNIDGSSNLFAVSYSRTF